MYCRTVVFWIHYFNLTNLWVFNSRMTDRSGSYTGVIQDDWERLLKSRLLGHTSEFLIQGV
jgi:hypothetical protein